MTDPTRSPRQTPPEPPHRPRRDDDVAAWLKRQRDLFCYGDEHWTTVDMLLDRYRECADYGLTLRPEDDGAGDP